MPLSESQARFAAVRGQVAFGLDGKTPMRVRDVFYWYIDYREFADVVKYRIAMMRRGIDDKVKLVRPVSILTFPLSTDSLSQGEWCTRIRLS